MHGRQTEHTFVCNSLPLSFKEKTGICIIFIDAEFSKGLLWLQNCVTYDLGTTCSFEAITVCYFIQFTDQKYRISYKRTTPPFPLKDLLPRFTKCFRGSI